MLGFTRYDGDPLSKEVSTPNISFMESALEVASRPVDKGVTGPARELTSTSGHVSEEVEVAVSCANLQSTLCTKDLIQIATLYDLEVLMPYELERPHHLLAGYVTLSETYLKFDVSFPLHLFFVEVLKYFGVTVFQVTPNGWTHMIGLFGLFVERGMGPSTAAEFTWFYSIKANKNDEGLYYFAKRPLKGL